MPRKPPQRDGLYLRGKTWWIRYQDHEGRHIRESAGSPDRRDADWLVMRGVPLIEVRDLLGHASVKTTEIYAHLAPHRVRAAVNLLDEKT